MVITDNLPFGYLPHLYLKEDLYMSPWKRRFQASSKLEDRRGVTLPYFPETFNRYLVSMGTTLEILWACQKTSKLKVAAMNEYLFSIYFLSNLFCALDYTGRSKLGGPSAVVHSHR